VAAGDVYGPQGLVAAINQANASSSLDVICLSQGAYALTTAQVMDTGLPLITSPIEIRGSGAAIIRDPASASFRIFRVITGGTLILDTLSLSGGRLENSDGGAILNVAGTVVIRNSLLTSHTARNGGAVFNDNGSFSLINSNILSNSAPNASGGGILNAGINSTVFISNTTIENNAASSGGGIYNSDGRITVEISRVINNRASSAAGLYNSNFGVVQMIDSVMSGNNSLVFGGAVAAQGASITIQNSCISNNTSPLGSGIVNLNTNTSIPAIQARFNWWGAADGPSGAGSGSGDSISGAVDYIPFLTEPLPFCPPATSLIQRLLANWAG
jgi:hypothetical protein